MGEALQDIVKGHCFGCGSLNAHGLQIKSRWDGDELLCKWQPAPHHIGYPGYVYGGIIASVVDCHCVWTAMAHYCRQTGYSLENGAPPFAYVTGTLNITYLKPVPIEGEIELRACVLENGERKARVGCQLLHSGIQCATAEVVTVKVEA